MKCWTDEGRCSSCKFCSMDMDMEPFCVHPNVRKIWTHGLTLNRAVNEYCGPDLNLRIARQELQT